ncbi:MAG: high-affinity nickel-transport family protein [Gemmatimonadetes bacterium]|nr:high-affinity nickel-transport family protein [Gemmatimonadota bacterium]
MSRLLLLTAFTLGAAHAVAPDHLAAVGVFVSRARSTREALTHGARWGVGHALTLTLAGLAVLFAAGAWPQLLSLRAEWLVGVVLIGLGARTVWRAARDHMPSSAAAHAHSHANSQAHRHPLLGIGMLHGLAGSGAMAAMVPLGTGQHPWQAALWLALFGAGTIAAMALIAGAAGWSLRAAAARSTERLRVVVAAAGLASMAVGALWLTQTTW